MPRTLPFRHASSVGVLSPLSTGPRPDDLAKLCQWTDNMPPELHWRAKRQQQEDRARVRTTMQPTRASLMALADRFNKTA